MEESLNGGQPQANLNGKLPLKGDNLKGDNLKGDNLNGRGPQWKTASMENDIKEALQEADDISSPSWQILY